MILANIFSTIIGAIGGFAYGLLFRTFPTHLIAEETSSSKRKIIFGLFFSLGRCVFLVLFWFCILRSEQLNSILVTISFVGMFLVATLAKEIANGRYQFFRSR